ncbi:hypothetical protein IWX90DRAFT_445921 [Phyllosticta citrichinensis]|uniref:Uncharacterized protein n=1 Tax=Phyllosticta citrichinensis TaxID=1130410 RepID=A0ABR1XFH1_9PEZI
MYVCHLVLSCPGCIMLLMSSDSSLSSDQDSGDDDSYTTAPSHHSLPSPSPSPSPPWPLYIFCLILGFATGFKLLPLPADQAPPPPPPTPSVDFQVLHPNNLRAFGVLPTHAATSDVCLAQVYATYDDMHRTWDPDSCQYAAFEYWQCYEMRRRVKSRVSLAHAACLNHEARAALVADFVEK